MSYQTFLAPPVYDHLYLGAEPEGLPDGVALSIGLAVEELLNCGLKVCRGEQDPSELAFRPLWEELP